MHGDNAFCYTFNALVLHEKELELYTSSGKWLIKVSGSEIQAVNNIK